MTTPAENRLLLIDELKQIIHRLETGCHDHTCDLVPPSPGVHTNGGCHCWRTISDSLLYLMFDIVEPITKPGKNRRCW